MVRSGGNVGEMTRLADWQVGRPGGGQAGFPGTSVEEHRRAGNEQVTEWRSAGGFYRASQQNEH